MKKQFFFLFFFLFTSALFSESVSNVIPADLYKHQIVTLMNQRKDPFFAAVLSGLYSGAGQFYNENYQLGSLLFLGETTYYVANYILQYHFNKIYGSGIQYESLSTQDLGLLVFSYVAFLSIKSFSMYDAYISAERKNKFIEHQLDALQFSVKIDSEGIRISRRF